MNIRTTITSRHCNSVFKVTWIIVNARQDSLKFIEVLPDDTGRQAGCMWRNCLKLTGFESCSKAKLFLTERISPKLLLRKLLPGWIMGSPLTSNFNNFGSLKSLPPPSHTLITSTSSTQEAEVSTSWALTRVPPHRSRSSSFLVKTRALQGSSPGPLLSPPTTL